MSAVVRGTGIRTVARQLAVAVVLCTGVALPPVLAADAEASTRVSAADGEWPAPQPATVGPVNASPGDGEWPRPASTPVLASDDGEWPTPPQA
ncbi:hypothetical protein ACIBLA_37300 [Streptomyces sp. NPDC050433]|uniref:hypothetical protein n=1 Tax=Streptomyces sp. NPDC050433 TaxID=3365615 RepID=UPI0037A34349